MSQRIKVILSILGLSIATTGFATKTADSAALSARVAQLEAQIKALSNQPVAKNVKASLAPQLSVTTAPFLGARSRFDGADLLVNWSTSNEDLALLRYRQRLAHDMAKQGQKGFGRPIIEFSGGVETWAQSAAGYNKYTSNDIDVARAELDILSYVSSSVTGYMSISYDETSLDPSLVGSTIRTKNSNLYLRRAFIMVGDLARSPYYMTAGQQYVPFIRGASSQVTLPLMTQVGRTKARAVTFGYSSDAIDLAAYAFRGDSTVGEDDDHNHGIHAWGLQAKKSFHFKNGVKIDGGLGYLANFADTEGMQAYFSQDKYSQRLNHTVPAFDAHFEASAGGYHLNVEYLTATKSFYRYDLSDEKGIRGAKPSIIHTAFGGAIQKFAHPLNWEVGYAKTVDMGYLNVPEAAWYGVASTSLWKHTIESIEYRHNAKYATTADATHNKNIVTMQIGFYF